MAKPWSWRLPVKDPMLCCIQVDFPDAIPDNIMPRTRGTAMFEQGASASLVLHLQAYVLI